MIFVVGIGPGLADFRTVVANQLIASAQWIVGADRQLLAVSGLHQAKEHVLDKKLADLVVWLKEHQKERVVVLASGDPMLYGIGKYLLDQLPRESVEVESGLSSIQYLFSKVGLDMNDVFITSAHGKNPDFDFIAKHEKVAMVTDQNIGPFQIAQEMIKRGWEYTFVIGEQLSYPDEVISILPAYDVVDRLYQMNVVVIYQ